MAIRRLNQGPGFVVRHDQPLLGVPLQEEGHEVVCYFAEYRNKLEYWFSCYAHSMDDEATIHTRFAMLSPLLMRDEYALHACYAAGLVGVGCHSCACNWG